MISFKEILQKSLNEGDTNQLSVEKLTDSEAIIVLKEIKKFPNRWITKKYSVEDLKKLIKKTYNNFLKDDEDYEIEQINTKSNTPTNLIKVTNKKITFFKINV